MSFTVLFFMPVINFLQCWFGKLGCRKHLDIVRACLLYYILPLYHLRPSGYCWPLKASFHLKFFLLLSSISYFIEPIYSWIFLRVQSRSFLKFIYIFAIIFSFWSSETHIIFFFTICKKITLINAKQTNKWQTRKAYLKLNREFPANQWENSWQPN